jgi:polysaccharide export outer membrane protein
LPGFSEVTKMKRLISLDSVLLIAGTVVWSCVAFGQTPPQSTASGQTAQPPVSLSPAMPVADPAKMAEPAVTKPDGATVPETFVLGAEDQIQVTMWDEPKFDGSYIIRPDGKIMVKLIGEIQAAGLTPLELQEAINKAASNLIRTPRSTINVLQVHSKKVYFDGEGIASPGAMDLVIPMHLLEGISSRGGFKDFADKKHIKILREGKVFMIVNYKDLVSGKHPEKNILLLDKDHVVVN